MVASLLFGAISLVWGVMGLVLTVAPTGWLSLANKVLHDHWARFWVAQGILLVGLVLLIGSAPLQGFWLWVSCGIIAIAKGCMLLGSTESFRERLARVVLSRSMWVYRSSGLLSLVLAVLLAADTILHG